MRVLAGKYRYDRELGRGGTGLVIAATHVEIHQLVAIKILSENATAESKARFIREAKLVARLKSEHVVRVLDAGQLDTGEAFIAMEYLEGKDLQALSRERGVFPVEEACDYMLQACEGLAEAHAAGMVHRDVKPANLFIARGAAGVPTVKVLDFGISKADHTGSTAGRLQTSADAFLGTPRYMSPEQVLSARDVDARSDIWSLGIVLYTLLTGRHAFEGRRLAEVLQAITDREPAPIASIRPDVPPELAGAVARCLRKNPAERFQNLAELARVLAPFAGADARTHTRRIFAHLHMPSADSVPPPAPMEPQTRSRAQLVIVVAGASFLGAALITVWMARTAQHRASPPPLRSAVPSATLTPVEQPELDTLEVQRTAPSTTSINSQPSQASNTTASSLVARASETDAPRWQGSLTSPNAATCLAAWQRIEGTAYAKSAEAIRGHGRCLMVAGRCEEGRNLVREGYPGTPINFAHNYAVLYCPRSQLTPDELTDRMVTDLDNDNKRGDHASAIAHADEFAAMVAKLPRNTPAERKTVESQQWFLGRGYAQAGRCDTARKTLSERCTLVGRVGPAADECVTASLQGTSCVP